MSFSYASGQCPLCAEYSWIEVVLDCTPGIHLSKGHRAGLAVVKKQRGHEGVSPAPFGVVAAVGCVLGRVWGFSKAIHPYAAAGLCRAGYGAVGTGRRCFWGHMWLHICLPLRVPL